MWWLEIASLGTRTAECIAGRASEISRDAIIEAGAILEDTAGPIIVGSGTRICAGAIVRGPAVIGNNSMVGNYAVVRGPVLIGDQASIGFVSEIKNARLGDRVSIGPQCYVADSILDDGSYLGAMVRTSNQRLDRKSVTVFQNGHPVDTGMEKLGCWIGANAVLGIQVIILPGRIVAPSSVFEPRVTVNKNLPVGCYRLSQELQVSF